MSGSLIEIFEDEKLVTKIKSRLPYLFQLAELESSRGGKIGMEVGLVRERIIVALLIYKFGETNVKPKYPLLNQMWMRNYLKNQYPSRQLQVRV